MRDGHHAWGGAGRRERGGSDSSACVSNCESGFYFGVLARCGMGIMPRGWVKEGVGGGRVVVWPGRAVHM
jgi:hypothetical protein